MARIAADQAAGRVRDLSQDIPKGLAPARETMRGFLKEVERKFGADPRTTLLSLLLGKREGNFRCHRAGGVSRDR